MNRWVTEGLTRRSLQTLNMLYRLVALLVLSVVLISPIDDTIQGWGFITSPQHTFEGLSDILPLPAMTPGIVAVLAVLLFVAGFAMGLGAGTYLCNTMLYCSVLCYVILRHWIALYSVYNAIQCRIEEVMLCYSMLCFDKWRKWLW